MAIPLVIQDMFAIVKRQYPDEARCKHMYNVIRWIITWRDRTLPNSCRLDVLFPQRADIMCLCPFLQEHAADMDELFRLAGYISPPPPAIRAADVQRRFAPVHPQPEVNTPVAPPPRNNNTGGSGTLEINAEGFQSIVINFGNGKKIVLHV